MRLLRFLRNLLGDSSEKQPTARKVFYDRIYSHRPEDARQTKELVVKNDSLKRSVGAKEERCATRHPAR
jgi:hypothetical protein